MSPNDDTLRWLLDGDVAVQYQTRRYLLGEPPHALEPLQRRIATEGWGARFLAARRPDGHWGRAYYAPKWTSTHYTLLDLKNLAFPPQNEAVQASVDMVLDMPKATDGGIGFARSLSRSDVCVNGMVLSFAAYFKGTDERLNPFIDYLLDMRMPDGAWNCEIRNGACQGSLHTTLSVLEGLLEYRLAGNTYRLDAIRAAEQGGVEFLLEHHLFKSRRTGLPIGPKFTRLNYPSRWWFNILRALDYFRQAGLPYDERLEDALKLLTQKQKRGRWLLPAPHPGQVHFEMEKPGKPSRWNTLLALGVLGWAGA
ncbi:MAG: hypothetical protein KDC66_04670 [Phaeodactylibacter sp.]|nr:hypothetical protein [Phaeodactylibacter sp.]MCB9276285.1 hypothetical protein [Lewinellaceae bacterium]